MILLLALLPAPAGITAQATAAGTDDAYLDPTARALHEAARTEWVRIDETVVRYTALVRQRFAAGIRTPLKDRTVFRSESAHRVFWDRDGESLVQVLALREQTPAGVEEDDDITGAFGDAFDPAGDRLLFGMAEREEDEWGEPEGDDFWVEHPLGADATASYRFQTGDTLTLSFPDGRSVEAVELRVIPRQADVHRITGSLWVEPETGALVRAVYRLADTFDAFRDIPDLRDEEDDDLRFIPGFFKPWTFELGMISVEYALWEFEAWLPRAFRVEGVAAAGVLKAPLTLEVSYRTESVVTDADLLAEAAGEAPLDVMEERHFQSRAEAMAYLAELAGGEGVEYRVEGDGDRAPRYLVPADPDVLVESVDLPPPVWEDAPGFPSTDDLDELVDRLESIPLPPRTRTAWAANWGLQRPDLVRYNRVEGPALGARLQLRVGSAVGPLSLSLEPFLGFADLEPKARVSATRETLRRAVALGGYRELRPVSRRGRHLGLGNSLGALLWGRDDGEYFMASGADVTVTPPSAERESWRVRLYAERHEDVDNGTDFAVTHAFEDDWVFRPNLEATERDEVGVELVLSPWWGSDPLAPQFGLELYGQGTRGLAEAEDYARARALLRGVVPFGVFGWDLRAGLEVEGGRSWGGLPPQREWYLGSVNTLRGYEASILHGASFGRARAELGRTLPAVTVTVFSDAGWAGPRPRAFHFDDGLISAGVGVSALDGLLRLDLSRGLRPPRDTRVDFYLDAAF